MVPSLSNDLMEHSKRSESPMAGREGMLIFTWTQNNLEVALKEFFTLSITFWRNITLIDNNFVA